LEWSSFKPHAKSKLANDPATGLMQVRPKTLGLDSQRMEQDVEYQIKSGSDLLKDYYKRLGNSDDALHAYNVGLTNFNTKKRLNPRYAVKVKAEKNKL